MRNICEIFRRYKGQPVEVIMDDFRVVGIIVESDESGATLIDKKGRVVRVLNEEIEAVIEPQMHLRRVLGNDDEGFECDCGRGRDCGTSYNNHCCRERDYVERDCGCERNRCCDDIDDAF